MSHEMSPSTLYIMLSMHLLRNQSTNYKKRDGWTDRQTHGRTTDRLWYEINIPYFSNEKAGIIIVNAKFVLKRLPCIQTNIIVLHHQNKEVFNQAMP